MAFCAGYRGGNRKNTPKFRSNLIGADGTGQIVVSKINYTLKNQKGKREGKPTRNRWA